MYLHLCKKIYSMTTTEEIRIKTGIKSTSFDCIYTAD